MSPARPFSTVLVLSALLTAGPALGGGGPGKDNKELEAPPAFTGIEESGQAQRSQQPAIQQQQVRLIGNAAIPPTYYDVNQALRWLGKSPALQTVYKAELELLTGISDVFERHPNLQQKMSLFIQAGIEPATGGTSVYRGLDRRMNGMMLILSTMKRSKDPRAVQAATAAWDKFREFISFSRAIIRKVLSDPQRFAGLSTFQWEGRTWRHEDALKSRKEALLAALETAAQAAEKVSFSSQIKRWEDANKFQLAAIEDQILPEDNLTYDRLKAEGRTWGYSYIPLPLLRDDLKPASLRQAEPAAVTAFGRNSGGRRINANGPGTEASTGGDIDFGFDFQRRR